MDWLQKLSTVANLKRAWQRIQTGQNTSYKNGYRSVYEAYERTSAQSLARLGKALKDGTYQPTPGLRTYVPKPNKLQRPITQLTVDDQIVYQAFANVVATRLTGRRSSIESLHVHSNHWTTQTNSNYMFARWQPAYQRYRRNVRNLELSGYTNVVSFDLSAFYDTISHDLLLSELFGTSLDAGVAQKVKGWLSAWTGTRCSHGLPQGPIASELLAEAFFLPIDEALLKLADSAKFVRWVDDITILSKSSAGAQRATVRLEEMCRDRGLIPHAEKLSFLDRTAMKEFRGVHESLVTHVKAHGLSATKALEAFRKALGGRPLRIADSSTARFVLYRAKPDETLLKAVMRLLPHHPELSSAFAEYLKRFGRSKKIAVRLLGLIKDRPAYDGQEAAYWSALAQCCTPVLWLVVTELAVQRLAKLEAAFCATRCSLYEVLGQATQTEQAQTVVTLLGKESNFFVLAQGIAVSHAALRASDYSNRFHSSVLCSPDSGVALSAAQYVVDERANFAWIAAMQDQVNPAARDLLEQVGILRPKRQRRMSSISTLFTRRLRASTWNGWTALLGCDHDKARAQLAFADSQFHVPNHWMGLMDSLNDVILASVFNWLRAHCHSAGAPKTVNSKGELIDYGSLLVSGNFLEREMPVAYRGLRDFHVRRNELPSSHMRNSKTGRINVSLTPRGQAPHVRALGAAYDEIFRYLSSRGLS